MLPELAGRIGPLVKAAETETTLLFPSIPGHRTLAKDLTRAGIARKDEAGRFLDFHSLRYFFCTMLARSLPIQIVSKLMRHRDIRTTCTCT